MSKDEISATPQLDHIDRDSPPLDEKYGEHSHIENAEGKDTPTGQWTCPPDWHARLRDEYTGNHEGETLPPGADVDRAVSAILTMGPKESVNILKETLVWHARDLTFMDTARANIERLLQGHEACGMDYDDWAYETCKTAGRIANYSPYPEVRSVSLPYDDVDEPCESIRAWVLGMFWLIGCTCINTCEFGAVSQLMAQSLHLASLVSVSLAQWYSCCSYPWATFVPESSRTGDLRCLGNDTRSILVRGA